MSARSPEGESLLLPYQPTVHPQDESAEQTFSAPINTFSRFCLSVRASVRPSVSCLSVCGAFCSAGAGGLFLGLAFPFTPTVAAGVEY